MTLKFKEQVEREVEINVPCYRTNDTFIVKILAESESLLVYADGKGFTHREGLFWGSEDYFRAGWKDATREEFEVALDKFMAMLDKDTHYHYLVQ